MLRRPFVPLVFLSTIVALCRPAQAANELVLPLDPSFRNAALLDVHGDGNRLEISQSNFADADLAAGNVMRISIDGDWNGGLPDAGASGFGALRQSGSGNLMEFTLNGSENRVAATQVGSSNAIEAMIVGTGNQASVTQMGIGNVAHFSQSGIGNIVNITQTSW